MLASRFITDSAHRRRPGALVRLFERAFDRTLAAYTRTLDAALAHRRFVLAVALATFAATAALFAAISKGFFPEEDIGQLRISTEASEDISFAAMVALQDRAAAIVRADPNVATVSSFNGGFGAQNTGRMFVNLKPRAERLPMKQVVEGLRRKLREVPGLAAYPQPVQNLQLGGRISKSQFQYILQSVKADELNDWAAAAGQAVADLLFRGMTQRLEWPAGQPGRPRPRHARRLDRVVRSAPLSVSASARSRRSTRRPTATR
jgi:HAE1 family hydrophobic/amphiphilic exporter-1